MSWFRKDGAPVPADAARLADLEKQVGALTARVRTLELDQDVLAQKVRAWMRRAGDASRDPGAPAPAPPAVSPSGVGAPLDLSATMTALLQRGARGRIAARRLASAVKAAESNGAGAEEEAADGVHP